MSIPLAWLCSSCGYRVAAGRLVLPWALQGLRPAGLGLEIGAGGGAMAARLLAGFPDLRLVVTDVDPAMVVSARRLLAPFGERASLARADAVDLPFDDGRFDVVASFGMLHHVGEWGRALAEAVRVLRPGGRLVGFDVLDTRAVRWAHRVAAPGEIALFGPDRLAETLSGLPVTEVRIRRGPGGVLVRFTAATIAGPAGTVHGVHERTEPGWDRSPR